MKPVEYIKLTPKWTGLMPILWELAAQGNITAKEELMKLARVGDREVARVERLEGMTLGGRLLDALETAHGLAMDANANGGESPALTQEEFNKAADLVADINSELVEIGDR